MAYYHNIFNDKATVKLHGWDGFVEQTNQMPD